MAVAVSREASIHMLSLITSYRVTQIIHVAAKLGIADLLAQGPVRSAKLAEATSTHGPSLDRLLRALASIGALNEVEHGCYALTPLGQSLRSDVPGSMRAWAMMVGGEHHWLPWAQLLYSVRTGQPAFPHVLGVEPFAYYNANPEAGQIFQAALSGLTQVVNPEILASYDFSGFSTLVDIGGGLGSLLASILASHPRARGMLFDMRAVIERAERQVLPEQVHARLRFVAGDFFSEVPAGGDAYLLKSVLHDWDDDRAVAILQSCHRAASPGSKVLIIEMVLPDGDEPFYGKLLDIEMLVSYTGRERTVEQYRSLLERAGFELARVVRTPALMSIVEGVRA